MDTPSTALLPALVRPACFALVLAACGCASMEAVEEPVDAHVEAVTEAVASDPSASVVRVFTTVDGKAVEPPNMPAADGSPAGTFQGFFVEGDLLVLDHEALSPFVDAKGDVQLLLEDWTPITMVRAGSVVDGLVVLEAKGGTPLELGTPRPPAFGDQLRKLSAPWEKASWLDEASLLEPEVQLGRRRASINVILSEWLGIWAAPGRPILFESGAVAGVELQADVERAWLVPRATLDALLERARTSEPRPIADYVVEALAPTARPGDLVTPSASGELVLDCARAICYGERVQFERKGWWHGLGYWTNSKDHVAWNVDLEEDTTYSVRVLSSCPASTAGTPVRLGAVIPTGHSMAENTALHYDVPATDSFLDFRWTELGKLFIPAGRSTVLLMPLDAPPLAVMDLDRFVLTPVPSTP